MPFASTCSKAELKFPSVGFTGIPLPKPGSESIKYSAWDKVMVWAFNPTDEIKNSMYSSCFNTFFI